MRTIAAVRGLASLLAPPRCAACARPCAADRPVCERCAAALAAACGDDDVLGDPSRAATAALPIVWAAPYAGVARELVSALKFRGRLAAVAPIAEALAAALLPESLTGGLRPTVVAVPPAPSRRRSRGFDPAELIAAAVARELGLPFSHCLTRADGPRQVGRRRAERLASPPRVWPTSDAPLHALLVDDVLTTGATLAACSAALRSAGTTHIRAAVFARAM